MAFQISPGVNVTEIDLTDSVPSTATTAAGMVGIFSWGPIGLSDEVTTISTVSELKNTYGKPNNESYKSYFTGANYLNYSRTLKIGRVFNELTTTNAVNSTEVDKREVRFKFISPVNSVSFDFVNSGVTYQSSSWQGITNQGHAISPYSIGNFVQGGVQVFDASTTVATVINELADNTLPQDWKGNWSHDIGSTTGVFEPIEDIVNVSFYTAKPTANASIARGVLFNDSLNPWSIGFLNNKTRIEFGSTPSFRSTPTVIENMATFTESDGAGGFKLKVFDSSALILIPTGYGIADASGIVVTISSPTGGGSPATITVSSSLDTASGVTTFVHTGVTDVGAGLLLDDLVIDFSAAASQTEYTSLTKMEVNIPGRNTFVLPTPIVVNGGQIQITRDTVELSSVSEFEILTDPEQAVDEILDKMIYINTGTIASPNNNIFFDSGGTLADFELISYGPIYGVLEQSAELIKGYDDGVVAYGGSNIFAAKYPGVMGNGITIEVIDHAITTSYVTGTFFDDDVTEQTNLLSVVVRHPVLGSEVFSNLTKSQYLAATSGENRNWIDYINKHSNLIWVLSVPLAFRESTSTPLLWKSDVDQVTVDGLQVSYNKYWSLTADHSLYVLNGGSDGVMTLADWINALVPFKNTEISDISLLFAAGDGLSLSDYVTLMTNIMQIASDRKDTVAVVSPYESEVTSAQSVISFYKDLRTWFSDKVSQSYVFVDSNYKYQYDVHFDKYRWVPLCGDIAGIMSRTDEDRDPWFSPAGFNRGGIKGVSKLKLQHSKTDRDSLYRESINPVTSFPGQGTILYGDKTFTTKVSSFDRINVRRLFIVLEKLIAISSEQTLFEFNDDFTRGQFVSMITPFLREIQGRRGISDFKVICDDTNNTSAVIDANKFVGDVYIKPNRSINFIQLNFVAVSTGVEFTEVIGKF